jgi:hypothetical protein
LFREVKNVYLRKISFVEFSFALEEVAKRSGRSKAAVLDLVAELRGPVFTTHAAPAKQQGPERFFYDRKSFTGVHRYGGPTTHDEGRGGNITNISQILDRTPADKRGVKMYDDVQLRRSIPDQKSRGSLLGVTAFAPPRRDSVEHRPTVTLEADAEGTMTRRRSLTGERLEFSR